jgi:hypothetical protein
MELMKKPPKRVPHTLQAQALSDSYFRKIMDAHPLFLLYRPQTVKVDGRSEPLSPACFKILTDALEVIHDEARVEKHVVTMRQHWLKLCKAIPEVNSEYILRDYLSGQRKDDRMSNPDLLPTSNHMVLAVGPRFHASYAD